jgi:hypothetical protein
MRAPGTLVPYIVVLALGMSIGGFFLHFMLFWDGDGERKPLKGFWLSGLGFVCAVYSLLQLIRPLPRQPRRDT